jgi:hypothetical protein
MPTAKSQSAHQGLREFEERKVPRVCRASFATIEYDANREADDHEEKLEVHGMRRFSPSLP